MLTNGGSVSDQRNCEDYKAKSKRNDRCKYYREACAHHCDFPEFGKKKKEEDDAEEAE